MRVVYIAGPYRSTNPNGKSNAWGVQQNVMRAMAGALEVWRRGHAAICPHSNTMFFQDADGCVDDVWLTGDVEILRRCDAVFVVDGWQKSRGAMAEVELASKWGKPILETVNDLERYLSDPDNVERVHRMFVSGVAARMRNVMSGTVSEFALDETGTVHRIAIDGEAYEIEFQEPVTLRRTASGPPTTVETSSDVERFCSCSVPDVVGRRGKPETFRCLNCGCHPIPSETLTVGAVPYLTITGDRVAELWSMAVRNAQAASMPDVLTFAQLIVDEVRSQMKRTGVEL